VKGEEALEVSYDSSTKKLNMTLKGKMMKTFTVPTLESTEEEVPTPKVAFNSRIKMTADALKDIVEDAQAVSDNVRLEASSDKLTVRAATELSSALIELEKGSDALLEIDVKEPSKATFNLNYLAEITKAGALTSEVAKIEFSTNMPIRLEFEMPQQGHLLYYLAPRIEAE